MNNENEVMEKAPVLTKKDCVKGAIRWSLMAVTTLSEPFIHTLALISALKMKGKTEIIARQFTGSW